MSALDPNAPDRVVAWQIQVDVKAGSAQVATGGAQLAVTLSPTIFSHWGVVLFATQATGRQSFGLNRISLKSTYLMSDTDNVKLGVVLVQA